MLTTARDRVGAALGALYVVLIVIGNALATAGTDQSSHPSGEHVLRDVIRMHGSTKATVGYSLEVLGFLALMGFLGFLADTVRRYGGRTRIAGGTAIVSALVMLAVKLGSAAPAIVLNTNRHTLTPQLAQVLNDLNGAAFVIGWLPFAVFVGTTGAALRAAGGIGRPTHVIAVALGVAGVLLGILGMRDVTGANPMAFLLGLLWVLVVSVRLAVRPIVDTPAVAATPSPRVAVPA